MVLFLLFTCGRDRLEIDAAQNEVPTGASFIKSTFITERLSGNQPASKPENSRSIRKYVSNKRRLGKMRFLHDVTVSP